MPVATDSGSLLVLAEADGGLAMDDTRCPEPGCELPAEILDRAILESTDGPIEHARIVCLGGHRFFMPTAMLPERHDVPGTRLFVVAGATRPGEQWSS